MKKLLAPLFAFVVLAATASADIPAPIRDPKPTQYTFVGLDTQKAYTFTATTKPERGGKTETIQLKDGKAFSFPQGTVEFFVREGKSAPQSWLTSYIEGRGASLTLTVSEVKKKGAALNVVYKVTPKSARLNDVIPRMLLGAVSLGALVVWRAKKARS